jgi:leucyl aminopeptidase (aminopeptidase T)
MGIEEGAHRVIETCLAVKAGEKVVVVVDAKTRVIGDALFGAALGAGAEAILVLIPPPAESGEEPPDPLARMMADCDVVILATSQSMTHTAARRLANRAGARIASLPGVTEDMLSEGPLTADYVEIQRTTRRLERMLRGAKSVRLASPLGTDVTFDVTRRDWITGDTGVCRRRGDMTTLPAGEIFVAPVEGSADGRLVFDATFHTRLAEPASVVVKQGHASKVTGAPEAVLAMNRGGKDGRNFGKVGIGLNPKARITGNVLEEEKVLGAVHVVFGDNAAYGGAVRCGVRVDAILTQATVEVDGKTILERGALTV